MVRAFRVHDPSISNRNLICAFCFANTHRKYRLENATMRLTSFTDYGLRILMRLAGSPDRPFSTGELADEFKVSRAHLAKVISALANAGYLKTRRGGGGGAVLSRPASDIRLGDVVSTLETGQPIVECFSADGSACTLTPSCLLKDRLKQAEQAFFDDLNQATLADCIYRPPWEVSAAE
ncbi:RrF2 family transcriptional regulator [Ruegeria arenilitoris]|uniref:RrF2 family transcriptional regulator n=1 Tax=Ruegeria arenilitoris TaxID=1173585 RepID=UPI003464D40B